MNVTAAFARSILLALALAAAGCATTGSSPASSMPAAAPAEGTGRIVFYRIASPIGYGMRPDILVDGKKVGESAPGMQFPVTVTPGKRLVSVAKSLYSGDSKLEVPVRNKEVVYVRTSIGMGSLAGSTDVAIVSAEEGASESAGLEVARP